MLDLERARAALARRNAGDPLTVEEADEWLNLYTEGILEARHYGEQDDPYALGWADETYRRNTMWLDTGLARNGNE